MNFQRSLLAAGLLAASSGAWATVDWAVHDSAELAAAQVQPGPFLEFYTFSLGATHSVTSVASSSDASFNGDALFEITGGTYALWSMGANAAIGGGDDSSLGSWAFDSSTASNSHSLNLGPGKYYYTVGGMGTGSAGGAYTLLSTTAVSAVPEPETYGMMLAGLGAIGFMSRRRTTRKN